MLKKIIILLAILVPLQNLLGQDTSFVTVHSIGIKRPYKNIHEVSLNKNRTWLVAGINVVGYGTSLILFSNAWYKNYPRSSFHTFNDSKEWLQVDKAGHAWGAYNTGQASAAMWRWAGLSSKRSALIGGLSGAGYLTVIEFLDAYSAQ